MQIALFGQSGLLFLFRWFHLFFGVLWIGLLYYFNFVQGAFFAETDAATKSAATQKLVPRALWWFRWAAMGTFITGLAYLGSAGHTMGPGAFSSSWGINILTGATLGTVMWANVWFVIWPNQKIVIENAVQVAAGKPANPAAAGAAARGLVASRTNTMFSIPMLFFMGAATHLNLDVTTTSLMPLIGVFAVVIGALEFNALKGKTGPLTTIKGVVHCGFALALVMYFAMEFLTKL